MQIPVCIYSVHAQLHFQTEGHCIRSKLTLIHAVIFQTIRIYHAHYWHNQTFPKQVVFEKYLKLLLQGLNIHISFNFI